MDLLFDFVNVCAAELRKFWFVGKIVCLSERITFPKISRSDFDLAPVNIEFVVAVVVVVMAVLLTSYLCASGWPSASDEGAVVVVCCCCR